jgi:hypothetical protein
VQGGTRFPKPDPTRKPSCHSPSWKRLIALVEEEFCVCRFSISSAQNRRVMRLYYVLAASIHLADSWNPMNPRFHEV